MKPITFSTPMVQAILKGRKTMTRRVLKPQPEHVWGYGNDGTAHIRYPGGSPPDPWVKLPYQVGDLLWVKETYLPELPPELKYDAEGLSVGEWPAYLQAACTIHYKADKTDSEFWSKFAWKPSIFMPKWAARIWLEVTGVKVERVQDITVSDIEAEGCGYWPPTGEPTEWIELSDSLNAKRGFGWDANPWVAAYTFKRVERDA